MITEPVFTELMVSNKSWTLLKSPDK